MTIRMKQPASEPDALGQVPTLVPHKQRGMSHSYREGLGAERERESVCVCVCMYVSAHGCARTHVLACACACAHPRRGCQLGKFPKLPFMVGYVSLCPAH